MLSRAKSLQRDVYLVRTALTSWNWRRRLLRVGILIMATLDAYCSRESRLETKASREAVISDEMDAEKRASFLWVRELKMGCSEESFPWWEDCLKRLPCPQGSRREIRWCSDEYVLGETTLRLARADVSGKLYWREGRVRSAVRRCEKGILGYIYLFLFIFGCLVNSRLNYTRLLFI